MKKKEYKVKIENGEIKPLEPIDLANVKEGIIIFFEEDSINKNSGVDKDNKIKSFESIAGLLSDLSDKDISSFEEEVKRRPLFKEKND